MKSLTMLGLIFSCLIFGQAQSTLAQNTKDCLPIDFHYLITQNSLYSPTVRHIEVFLDEKAFSEENLKRLFRYLADKNPTPKHLTVEVLTNWAQLPLNYDCPQTIMSEEPDKPDEYDYFQAVFTRREKDGVLEYFRYNPTLKIHSANFKVVIMKGKSKD